MGDRGSLCAVYKRKLSVDSLTVIVNVVYQPPTRQSLWIPTDLPGGSKTLFHDSRLASAVSNLRRLPLGQSDSDKKRQARTGIISSIPPIDYFHFSSGGEMCLPLILENRPLELGLILFHPAVESVERTFEVLPRKGVLGAGTI